MVRIIADLHIHSRFSRATSPQINVAELVRWTTVKGLTLVGTGDATHPLWLKELKQELEPVQGTGLYKKRGQPASLTWFMVTAEISTVYEEAGKTRKIHHVLWIPSLEEAEQLCEALRPFGRMDSDGRPTLKMTGAEAAERIFEASKGTLLVPAHVWTPWFSLFGDRSGFDTVEDCYEEHSSKIHALETGLSSDPSMNWRLSILDKYAMISNSDSHSLWPWRLGREACVFDLERVSFDGIISSLKDRDPARFRGTIEVDPAYGKYHWTGHHRCGLSLPSEVAISVHNICPKCGKRLAKGVDQRVSELADRPKGFRPVNAQVFVHLLPLHEVLATALGSNGPNSAAVWSTYNKLIEVFGNEFKVLLTTPYEVLATEVGKAVAVDIMRNREGRIEVVPGYDGVYGHALPLKAS